MWDQSTNLKYLLVSHNIICIIKTLKVIINLRI